MPGAMEMFSLRQWGQTTPVLPKVVVAMSVSLFLGYWIKNFLLPNFLFVAFYSWAIFSFISVPLCLAECFILARAGLSHSSEKSEGLRAHASVWQSAPQRCSPLFGQMVWLAKCR